MQLESAGFRPILIEGLDGTSGLDFKQCPMGVSAVATWHVGRALTGAEVGCAVGHLRAYKAALQLDCDWVIFFEDDARLGPDALKDLESLLYSLENSKPILLTLYSGAPTIVVYQSGHIEVPSRNGGTLRLAQSVTPPSFALAYVMNRSALQVAASAISIDGVADWPAWAEQFEFWIVIPWLAGPDSETPSLIEPSRKQMRVPVGSGRIVSDGIRRTRHAILQLVPKYNRAARNYYDGFGGLWQVYYKKRVARALRGVPLLGRRARSSSQQIKLR